MNARKAILESIQTNSIVHLPWSEAAECYLRGACEGSARGNELEFWGVDEDSHPTRSEWRVHLAKS